VTEETKIWLRWLLKYTLILPVLAAVSLFAVFFILLVWFGTKDFPPNDKVWDWLIAVVGTLLSFIVGLVGAAAHLRARRKAHLRHLLSVELKDLRETLKGSNDNTQPTSTHIHPRVIEEAIMSGLFKPELTENMLRLLNMYQKYDAHTPSSSTAKAHIENCITNIQNNLGLNKGQGPA
jgi:hypothetical protein